MLRTYIQCGTDQATLKKKFVSCPAGGYNKNQSGGRDIFFFLDKIFSIIKDMENISKKRRKIPKT